MDTVEGYKLFKKSKTGIRSLFINNEHDIPIGEWLPAQSHPTKGFAIRPGWHATARPVAPHLKMRLASGEQRVWFRVLLRGVTLETRPERQGGSWFLAQEMMILEEL